MSDYVITPVDRHPDGSLVVPDFPESGWFDYPPDLQRDEQGNLFAVWKRLDQPKLFSPQ
jgi:hypothetical protein